MQTVTAPELAALISETAEPRKLSKREREWFEQIKKLEPWQFHKLMIVGELDLHDRFISGEDFSSIFDEICAQGDENPYKKHEKDSDASPVCAE